MGRRKSQKLALVNRENDDTAGISSSAPSTDSIVRYSPSVKSRKKSLSGHEEELNAVEESVLDQALDALFEKRGSTRTKALESIVDSFSKNMQHEFVDKNYSTLLHQCLNSIKRGSIEETSLACHVTGLLALTAGCGHKAREILEESINPLSRALNSDFDSTKITSIIGCLAIITFVGGNDYIETEKSIKIMRRLIHSKLENNVVAVKPLPAAIVVAVVSAWTFLLTSMDISTLSTINWKEYISFFVSLLDKDDRSIRNAAGLALALIYEIGSSEEFSTQSASPCDDGGEEEKLDVDELKSNIYNKVQELSAEGGGKGCSKIELKSQRHLFKDILELLEEGCCPKVEITVGGELLHASTWLELVQLRFLKQFLGGGFVNHVQDNEFIQHLFGMRQQRAALSRGSRILVQPGSNKKKKKIQSSVQRPEIFFRAYMDTEIEFN